DLSRAGCRHSKTRRSWPASQGGLAQRRSCQGAAGEAAEVPGREDLAAHRSERGQEPRDSPDARPAPSQGPAVATGGHGAGPGRSFATGKGPQAHGPGNRGAAENRSEENPSGATSHMSALVHAIAPVLENVELARNTLRIRLQQPELAQAIRPGQFLMLR